MRTNVTFHHPARFEPLSDQDGILAVGGAQWFAALLLRVPGLHIDGELCQEDWGVVVFTRRNGKRFWVGLSAGDVKSTWLAHFHHGPFAWLQRLRPSGKSELRSLVSDVHAVLVDEPTVSDVVWYEEGEMRKPQPAGFRTPAEG